MNIMRRFTRFHMRAHLLFVKEIAGAVILIIVGWVTESVNADYGREAWINGPLHVITPCVHWMNAYGPPCSVWFADCPLTRLSPAVVELSSDSPLVGCIPKRGDSYNHDDRPRDPFYKEQTSLQLNSCEKGFFIVIVIPIYPLMGFL